MATIDRKRYFLLALGFAAVAGMVLFFYCRRLPPQIGLDEGVFNTVDALFTAVNSRDKRRLDDCEQRLRSYRESGKLPIPAAEYLDSIIKQARSGHWGPSARALYEFMRGQRRSSG